MGVNLKKTSLDNKTKQMLDLARIKSLAEFSYLLLTPFLPVFNTSRRVG